eukprot:jgi/Astpho2/2315/fgenesh1_pg.00042_%23_2_t
MPLFTDADKEGSDTHSPHSRLWANIDSDLSFYRAAGISNADLEATWCEMSDAGSFRVLKVSIAFTALRNILAAARVAFAKPDRISSLFFRGDIRSGDRGRLPWQDSNFKDALLLHPELDIQMTNWAIEETQESFVPLSQHCTYKYLLNWPGNTWSGRFKYLPLCASLVIHLNNAWYEDVTEGLVELVRWLQNNQEEAEQIGKAGHTFMQQVLTPHNVSHLIAVYKLMNYPVDTVAHVSICIQDPWVNIAFWAATSASSPTAAFAGSTDFTSALPLPATWSARACVRQPCIEVSWNRLWWSGIMDVTGFAIYLCMDAQHMEAKLLDEANAAWEAYLAEKDPARSDKLEKRWNKAQDTLERVSRATGGWRRDMLQEGLVVAAFLLQGAVKIKWRSWGQK